MLGVDAKPCQAVPGTRLCRDVTQSSEEGYPVLLQEVGFHPAQSAEFPFQESWLLSMATLPGRRVAGTLVRDAVCPWLSLSPGDAKGLTSEE